MDWPHVLSHSWKTSRGWRNEQITTWNSTEASAHGEEEPQAPAQADLECYAQFRPLQYERHGTPGAGPVGDGKGDQGTRASLLWGQAEGVGPAQPREEITEKGHNLCL